MNAKALLSILCIIFCTPATVFSQKIKAQLIVGGLFSQIDGDMDAGYRKFGLTGGFGAHIPISGKFNLSFEGLYSNRGARSRLRCVDSTCLEAFKFHMDLHYVEIPVLITYMDKKRVNFGAGVSFNRLLNFNYFENGYKLEIAPDFIFNKSNMDYMLIAEGSYNMFSNLWINLRWHYSMTTIGSNPQSRYRRFGMFNNSIGIRLKYVFRPGGGKKIESKEDL